MALLNVHAWSRALSGNVSFDVILPEPGFGPAQGTLAQDAAAKDSAAKGVEGSAAAAGFPVLWLLHGASDDHSVWRRRTPIERYASSYGLAVVMPAAALSSYTDMAWGRDYFSYIADELPALCRSFFPRISEKREDNFIAGLSMGCYGAFRIALSRPERFAAAGGFSAGNSIFNRNIPSMFNIGARNLAAFGEADAATLGGTDFDLYSLAERAAEAGGLLPRIFHACGTEDFSYGSARALASFMGSIPGNPFAYEFHEAPGAHTWEFWDEWIQKFLVFTGLPSISAFPGPAQAKPSPAATKGGR